MSNLDSSGSATPMCAYDLDSKVKSRLPFQRIEAKVIFPGLTTVKIDHAQVIHFALCLNNEGYKASLEVGKLYRIIADEQASAHGLVRIVDESGEDYAFSADRFYPVPLPRTVEAVLLTAT